MEPPWRSVFPAREAVRAEYQWGIMSTFPWEQKLGLPIFKTQASYPTSYRIHKRCRGGAGGCLIQVKGRVMSALLGPCGKSPCHHSTGIAYAPLWCKQLSCHGDCRRGCWGPGELPASCYTSPSALLWVHGRSRMCAFSSQQGKVKEKEIICHLGEGFKIDF